MTYRSAPTETDRMPPGISFIIGNEAAERFSFYGMRTILVVFMVQYLHLMDDGGARPLTGNQALEYYHQFASWVYFTPLIGALIADIFLGKYRTILYLSIVYCIGHAALACMGSVGHSPWWLFGGLLTICLGSGGIKPCVSAHVGDQFGKKNHHLIPRIYHWFYFSINFGSIFSTLLTPWLLKNYGPHWAFGIPGILMAIATLTFWLGRHRFVHVPPSGRAFFKEAFSREGVVAICKLIPLFTFIAVFWSLFDQTGSSWVLQAEQMNLNFLGVDWLESQIQAVNPILILIFIPLFSFVIYPWINRFFPLTPLRKIGGGLILMTLAFGLTTLIQSWIDSGQRPSIGWQILAFVVITASEILVSIVGLEFAYTQAPKAMKSPRTVVLPGYDKLSSEDDMVVRCNQGRFISLEIPGREAFFSAASVIEASTTEKFPAKEVGQRLLRDAQDPWGNPLNYDLIDSSHARISSAGPDRKLKTSWDLGIIIEKADREAPASQETWLGRRKAELGITEGPMAAGFRRTEFSGGQSRLEGAAYFSFFTWLVLGTTLVFLPFSYFYRPRNYLND